jgi:hypothetical protein
MKNINCEEGGNTCIEQHRKKSILLCLGFATLGFIGGYHMKDNRQSRLSDFSPLVMLKDEKILEVSLRRRLGVEGYDEVDASARNAFSCNSHAAYDELTKLYSRRVELEKHRARGEANRDRTAVILRKTGQAEAAEQAFRSCVGKMVPELLKVWDDDMRKNRLRVREKLMNSKYDQDGVNLAVLEETADMLDSIQNP